VKGWWGIIVQKIVIKFCWWFLCIFDW